MDSAISEKLSFEAGRVLVITSMPELIMGTGKVNIAGDVFVVRIIEEPFLGSSCLTCPSDQMCPFEFSHANGISSSSFVKDSISDNDPRTGGLVLPQVTVHASSLTPRGQ
ncbi:conserved hypothetical protein [Ricinus communis]|uniref:Uncharacterized protein n=1 Tax=Ricinus communis TaxID=3988 RepID=B9S6G8_RICCO|nr:conserved hypothetical protein [Ricinus communis]